MSYVKKYHKKTKPNSQDDGEKVKQKNKKEKNKNTFTSFSCDDSFQMKTHQTEFSSKLKKPEKKTDNGIF